MTKRERTGRRAKRDTAGRRANTPMKRWRLGGLLVVAGVLCAVVILRREGREFTPVEPPVINFDQYPDAVSRMLRLAREEVVANPRDPDAWGRLGMVMFAHQFDPEPAICFEQAAALDPDEFRWPYLQALFLAPTQREAAAALYEQAIAIRQDVAVAHNRLGELLLDLGRYDQADHHFLVAQQLDPGEVRSYVAAARSALLQKNVQSALQLARRAEQLASDQRAIHELLATVYQQDGDRQAAIRELQAADSCPDQPLNWKDPIAAEVLRLRQDSGWLLEQGESLLAAGQVDDAIRLLHDAARRDNDDPRLPCSLARAMVSAGMHDQAAAVLEEAGKRFPDSAEVRFQLGVVYFFKNDFDRAAEQFRAAVQMKPDYALAHYNLGHALQRLNETESALVAFLAAVRYRPNHAGAHTNAGRILLDQGKRPEALEHLQIARQLDPNDPLASELFRRAWQANP